MHARDAREIPQLQNIGDVRLEGKRACDDDVLVASFITGNVDYVVSNVVSRGAAPREPRTSNGKAKVPLLQATSRDLISMLDKELKAQIVQNLDVHELLKMQRLLAARVNDVNARISSLLEDDRPQTLQDPD